MSVLTLQLLGGFRARVGDGPPLGLPTKKSQALLAYLALPAGREHGREKLMALLWGDAGERQARHSLRQALFTLRRTIGTGAGEVLVEGDAIALNPRAVQVDVATLERHVAEGSPGALARVVELYQGDLLDGLACASRPSRSGSSSSASGCGRLARGALTKLWRTNRDAAQVAEPSGRPGGCWRSIRTRRRCTGR